MNEIRKNFELRIQEARQYADLLRTLIFDGNNIELEGISRNRDHIKVGCSSLYIVIYNAIEYAVRSCVISVESEIIRNSIGYFDLCEYWRVEFVRGGYLHSLREGCNYSNILDQIASDIDIEAKYRSSSPLGKRIKNIGQKEIWKLVNSLGVKFNVDTISFNSDIEIIKSRRNLLAHGDESFLIAGDFMSIDDVISIISRVECYILEFINSMEMYSREKRYLRSN